MKLLPEVRNKIYEELLVFHDSSSCHPGMLATCKQIHHEASGILYGDNMIDVKMQQHNSWGDKKPEHDGTVAHGRSCFDGDVTNLQWPDFLHRLQKVKFSATQGWPEEVVWFTLYHLCSTLKSKHNLVAFEVDIQCVTGSAHRILNTLQLLDEMKLINILGHQGSEVALQNLRLPSSDIINGNVLGTYQALRDEVELCNMLYEYYRPYLEPLLQTMVPLSQLQRAYC